LISLGSGRKVSYGEVAEAASKITPPDPKEIKLKDPKDWKVAGKPMKRLDTAEKTDGSKKYAIDIVLPGMLVAAIRDCPVFGGKVASFDESKIAGKPGLVKTVKVGESGVAVVADSFWHAKSYLEQLPVTWDEAGNGDKSSATIKALLEEGLNSTGPDNGGRKEGDAPGAIARAAKKVEAIYSTPFLAHATMEPMNCIARVSANKAEAWAPTQNAESSLASLSEASGVPLANCEVYRTDPGGGFGRRGGGQDYVRQAAQIAKQFPGTPIKLIWTREEDQAHDFFRPISMMKGEAGLDAQGNVVGLRFRIAGQSINAWSSPGNIVGGKDERQLQGLWKEPGDAQLGYGAPNLMTEYMMRNTHVPVGAWRGVNTNQNAIYVECFMEEVARAAGKDSLEFRRGLMKEFPKHLAVLNAAAEKGDWGKPLPAGHFRGIAQFMGYGSYSAAVAEISLKPDGKVKVHRMVLALNCGIGVNPDQITAQVEGSVAYGLSATFYGECAVEKGRMVNLNFDKYEILRLADYPKVETVIVNTGEFWGGVGEPTICVVAPSVLNAVYAATGKPVRSLPLRGHKLA
jgi:isoquinoline 1-oxidoreductase beta subunit